MKILNDIPISSLSPLPLKGHFRKIYLPETISELIECFISFEKKCLKYCLWGRGTDILPIHSFIQTPIILYKKPFYAINDEQIIASFNLSGSFLGRILYEKGFQNLLGVETIPGTLGAGIKNNATFKDFTYRNGLEYLWIYDKGKTHWKRVDEYQFEYRKTNISGIVLLAIYKPILNSSTTAVTRKELENYRKKQPRSASLGSTFKNPIDDLSYRLINEVRSDLLAGNVSFSTKHANFLEFQRETTPEDVYSLIEDARKRVFKKTGINLELEIKLLE